MNLVIYFSGTLDEGRLFLSKSQFLENNDRVATLIVKGCHDRQVCNSVIFPDLKSFAQRFTRKLFKKSQSEVNLSRPTLPLLETLNIGITNNKMIGDFEPKNRLLLTNGTEPIESITLCGYSRGAVTCFEIARQLNKIAPNIPVDIIADQPVPGNLYPWHGSNARRILDCRDLTNVKNATVILGSYTSAKGSQYKDYFHRLFFSQISPQLPKLATKNYVVIPREHHNASQINTPERQQHLNLYVAKSLAKFGAMTPAQITILEDKITEAYHQNQDWGPYSFPPIHKLDPVIGIDNHLKHRFYRNNLDQYHPRPNLRENWYSTVNPTGLNIHQWFGEKFNAGSKFSSFSEMKIAALVAVTTDETNVNALIKLYTVVDRWLLSNERKPSSRYGLFEALHHQLAEKLSSQLNVSKHQLHDITLKNVKQTHYIYNQWQLDTKDSFFLKEPGIKRLDEIFKTFDTSLQQPVDYQQLQQSLISWKDDEKNANNKHYDNTIYAIETIKSIENKYINSVDLANPETLTSNHTNQHLLGSQ